jgi:hypothetical protein
MDVSENNTKTSATRFYAKTHAQVVSKTRERQKNGAIMENVASE